MTGAAVVARVARLRTSPVKGLAQQEVGSLELIADGIRGDRRFVCADERLRRLYTADLGPLARATATWDEEADVLVVALPDGRVVEGVVECAVDDRELVSSSGRPMVAREVLGPFAMALAEVAGQPLRLFRVPVGVGAPGPLTLLGDGSVARLAGALGLATLDARRFKMSMELEGVAPHEEDAWEGQALHVGEAEIVVGGPVPRCVVTTRDPDTQERDLDTLRVLLACRGALPTGEPPFGVYATVARPGVVRVGDTVTLAR